MTIQRVDPEKQEYVYGPVPSRRLGRSLGVDLVPFKTCTYDCIYCQLGKTTDKTIERKEWVSVDTLINQVKGKLESKPDYIALSGSGEPTLHSRIGEIITGIKKITDIPVAVLTNGSLLWLPELRRSLMAADLVLPSLDAGSDRLFRYVNRPHPDIPFDKMLEGLVAFRNEYAGEFWLEVLLMNGVTTVEAHIDLLARHIKLIGPDKVQVNAAIRPPAEDFAMAVPLERLKKAASQLSEEAEVIVAKPGIREQCETSARLQDVLALLRRRPCSVDDIALGLGLHRNAVIKYVEQLCSQRQAQIELTTQGQFYKAPMISGK
ncbi:MAG: radical SAM protein [Chloroflexi bacterium]|nr:MAG: radical SAM protein [Chloroflexota bacterium]HEC02938.1 radical SAM protein [Phycisphaerales bacterium]